MSVSRAADDATPLISGSAAEDSDDNDPDAYECPLGFLFMCVCAGGTESERRRIGGGIKFITKPKKDPHGQFLIYVISFRIAPTTAPPDHNRPEIELPSPT